METRYCEKCFKKIESNSDHQKWCPYKQPEAISIEDIFGDIFKQPEQKK